MDGLFELPADDLSELDGTRAVGMHHVGHGQPLAERPNLVGAVHDLHAQRRGCEQDALRGLERLVGVGHVGALGQAARDGRLAQGQVALERALQRVDDPSVWIRGLQRGELGPVGGGDLRQVGRGLRVRERIQQIVDVEAVDKDHSRRVRGVGLDERGQTVGLHGPSTLPAGLVAGDARATVIQVEHPHAGDGRDLFGLVGRPAGGRARVRAGWVLAHVAHPRVRVYDQLRVAEQCERALTRGLGGDG